MYVLVRFCEDGLSLVTKSDAIENFKPRNVKDLNSSDVHMCYWEGDNLTHGGFYEAQIVHMTNTLDEMEKYQALNSRKRLPASSQKVSSQKTTKTSKNTKRKRAAVQQQQQLLEQDIRPLLWSDDDSDDDVVPKKLLVEKEQELDEMRSELVDLKRLNKELQAALCSKVFEKENDMRLSHPKSDVKVIATGHLDRSAALDVDSEPPSAAKACQPESMNSSKELGSGTGAPSLHMSKNTPQGAQQCSSSGSGASNVGPCVASPVGSSQSTSQGRPRAATQKQSARRGAEDNLAEWQTFVTFSDDKALLGDGVEILLSVWQDLKDIQKDSLFCKELAVAIWGAEELGKRSITGTLSNKARKDSRKQAKPPLTPVKLAAVERAYTYYLSTVCEAGSDAQDRAKRCRKYLREKLGDLGRK